MPRQKYQVPTIALSHGQALWILTNMGYRTGDTPTAFTSYIMGLRRDGLPFDREELGGGAGHNVTYRFEHMMELAVALALRAQAILPRDIVSVLARHRDHLWPIYRQAWAEREIGLGAPETIHPGKQAAFKLSGIYLDLRLMYADSGFLGYPPPQALSPGQAVVRQFTANIGQHVRGHLPLTELAEEIVKLAPGAPEIRRGRRA
jgi:hypothetical protein